MIKGISINNSKILNTILNEKKENFKNKKIEKSKVESLKELIKSGAYKIDINKTSQKMAKALL